MLHVCPNATRALGRRAAQPAADSGRVEGDQEDGEAVAEDDRADGEREQQRPARRGSSRRRRRPGPTPDRDRPPRRPGSAPVRTLSTGADARPPPPRADIDGGDAEARRRRAAAGTRRGAARRRRGSRTAAGCAKKTSGSSSANGTAIAITSDLAWRTTARSKSGAKRSSVVCVAREALRDELLRQRAPVLVVQVRVERRREDARVGQRLDDEEDDVGEQEQLERADEGLAPALAVGQRQAARMDAAARAGCAGRRPSTPADRLHQLRRDALQREVERADRALAAARAERRRRRGAAARRARLAPGRSPAAGAASTPCASPASCRVRADHRGRVTDGETQRRTTAVQL